MCCRNSKEFGGGGGDSTQFVRTNGWTLPLNILQVRTIASWFHVLKFLVENFMIPSVR